MTLLKVRRHPAGASLPFPGYIDMSEIGTGHFASVYRATELSTGRQVALKVLRLSGPGMAETFEKEVNALALLGSHPHVTTLFGTFSSPDGRPVLVLELCRGTVADQGLQRGAIGPAEVVQLGVKVGGALGTAHRWGLLHRAVRPEKLLVSQFGEPVLGDFGLAALRGATHLDNLHVAPEELEGLPASPATDVYGLASSMYQLIVGRSPFAAYEGEAPVSAILRLLRDPAPRLPAGPVPVDLADLLEAALAKDPRDRPPSADAFAEALRAIEARAGWPQTPYIVWGGRGGTALAAAPEAAPAADALGTLPTTRSAAALARSLVAALDPPDPWRPTAAVDLPPPPSPGAPSPPGTRAVIAPPVPVRNVVVPVPFN